MKKIHACQGELLNIFWTPSICNRFEILGNNVISLEEGDKVILACKAHSNPPPFNYHWRHNGKSKVIRHTGLPSELILHDASR